MLGAGRGHSARGPSPGHRSLGGALPAPENAILPSRAPRPRAPSARIRPLAATAGPGCGYPRPLDLGSALREPDGAAAMPFGRSSYSSDKRRRERELLQKRKDKEARRAERQAQRAKDKVEGEKAEEPAPGAGAASDADAGGAREPQE